MKPEGHYHVHKSPLTEALGNILYQAVFFLW